MKYLNFLLASFLIICTGCTVNNRNISIINDTELDQSVFFDNKTKNDFIETTSIIEIQSIMQENGIYISEDGQFEYSLDCPKEIHVGDKFKLTGITTNNTDIESVLGYIGCIVEIDESKFLIDIPENFDEYERVRYIDGWNLHSVTPYGITEYTREYTAISEGTTSISVEWYMQIETEAGLKCYKCNIDHSINILP